MVTVRVRIAGLGLGGQVLAIPESVAIAVGIRRVGIEDIVPLPGIGQAVTVAVFARGRVVRGADESLKIGVQSVTIGIDGVEELVPGLVGIPPVGTEIIVRVSLR